MYEKVHSSFNIILKCVAASILSFLYIPSANAQLFVAEAVDQAGDDTRVAEYDLGGNVINSSLIYDSEPGATGLAVSGNTLAIASGNDPVYSLSGGNATYEYEVSSLLGSVAIVGDYLFVSSGNNEINQYNLSTGSFLNYQLYTGLDYPLILAPLGNDLLIANPGPPHSSGGSIQVFDPSTQTIVNPALVTGLVSSQLALAVTNSNLFVLNNNTIAEYTLTGTVVNSTLVSNMYLFGANSLAVSGNDLYVLLSGGSGQGRVAEFDATTGDLLNSDFISGLDNPTNIAIEAAPEPSTWLMLLGGLSLLIFWRNRGRQHL